MIWKNKEMVNSYVLLMECFFSQKYQRRRLKTSPTNSNESPSLELSGPRELSNNSSIKEIGAT